MADLPQEQDKLIRELSEIEQREKQHRYSERDKANLFLIIWSSILGPIFVILAYFIGAVEYLSPVQLAIVTAIGISSFIAAYYNKVWGFYYAAISTLGIDCYITYVNPYHYSDLITMLDAFTLFNISNQFFGKGYFIGLFVINLKIIVLYFLFPNGRDLDSMIYPIVSVSTIGIIPYLIHIMNNEARKAKKQTIRAEILSLQNGDLLASWQNYFQKGNNNASLNVAPKSNTQNNSGTDLPYSSPYGNTTS